MTEKLTRNEARQGKSGVGVSTVLLVSLLLAVIAGVALYAYGENEDGDADGLVEQQLKDETQGGGTNE